MPIAGLQGVVRHLVRFPLLRIIRVAYRQLGADRAGAQQLLDGLVARLLLKLHYRMQCSVRGRRLGHAPTRSGLPVSLLYSLSRNFHENSSMLRLEVCLAPNRVHETAKCAACETDR